MYFLPEITEYVGHLSSLYAFLCILAHRYPYYSLKRETSLWRAATLASFSVESLSASARLAIARSTSPTAADMARLEAGDALEDIGEGLARERGGGEGAHLVLSIDCHPHAEVPARFVPASQIAN
jgi:hypothetical protein